VLAEGPLLNDLGFHWGIGVTEVACSDRASITRSRLTGEQRTSVRTRPQLLLLRLVCAATRHNRSIQMLIGKRLDFRLLDSLLTSSHGFSGCTFTACSAYLSAEGT
jgi:hypothetical protein